MQAPSIATSEKKRNAKKKRTNIAREINLLFLRFKTQRIWGEVIETIERVRKKEKNRNISNAELPTLPARRVGANRCSLELDGHADE